MISQKNLKIALYTKCDITNQVTKATLVKHDAIVGEVQQLLVLLNIPPNYGLCVTLQWLTARVGMW